MIWHILVAAAILVFATPAARAASVVDVGTVVESNVCAPDTAPQVHDPILGDDVSRLASDLKCRLLLHNKALMDASSEPANEKIKGEILDKRLFGILTVDRTKNELFFDVFERGSLQSIVNACLNAYAAIYGEQASNSAEVMFFDGQILRRCDLYVDSKIETDPLIAVLPGLLPGKEVGAALLQDLITADEVPVVESKGDQEDQHMAIVQFAEEMQREISNREESSE